MSKDAWFREYERLLAEREVDLSDDRAVRQAADDAFDTLSDRMADQTDRIKDEAKERGEW